MRPAHQQQTKKTRSAGRAVLIMYDIYIYCALSYRLFKLKQAEVRTIVLEILDIFIYKAQPKHLTCILPAKHSIVNRKFTVSEILCSLTRILDLEALEVRVLILQVVLTLLERKHM